MGSFWKQGDLGVKRGSSRTRRAWASPGWGRSTQWDVRTGRNVCFFANRSPANCLLLLWEAENFFHFFRGGNCGWEMSQLAHNDTAGALGGPALQFSSRVVCDGPDFYNLVMSRFNIFIKMIVSCLRFTCFSSNFLICPSKTTFNDNLG